MEFSELIRSINTGADKPGILWYASAGIDFRPNVFLTDYHINHELEHHGRVFIKPGLFVFSCLGNEVRELREKLRTGSVLFEDANTRVLGHKLEKVTLPADTGNLYVNPDHVDTERISLPEKGGEAFCFEVEITHEHLHYRERQKVLYIEHENIDVFEKILYRYFNVQYLCASREGCGMGRCNKSAIEHIYKDAPPFFYSEKGFRPGYLILFNDFTRDLFKHAANHSELLDYREGYGDYIIENRERDSFDSTIYKLTYNS